MRICTETLLLLFFVPHVVVASQCNHCALRELIRNIEITKAAKHARGDSTDDGRNIFYEFRGCDESIQNKQYLRIIKQSLRKHKIAGKCIVDVTGSKTKCKNSKVYRLDFFMTIGRYQNKCHVEAVRAKNKPTKFFKGSCFPEGLFWGERRKAACEDTTSSSSSECDCASEFPSMNIHQ